MLLICCIRFRIVLLLYDSKQENLNRAQIQEMGSGWRVVNYSKWYLSACQINIASRERNLLRLAHLSRFMDRPNFYSIARWQILIQDLCKLLSITSQNIDRMHLSTLL